MKPRATVTTDPGRTADGAGAPAGGSGSGDGDSKDGSGGRTGRSRAIDTPYPYVEEQTGKDRAAGGRHHLAPTSAP